MQKMKEKKRKKILEEISEVIHEEIYKYKSSSVFDKDITKVGTAIEKGVKKILEKY